MIEITETLRLRLNITSYKQFGVICEITDKNNKQILAIFEN